MHEIAGLIREFPVGTFFIIMALIGAVVSIVRSVINRHKPLVHCDHDCCDDHDEEDEDEEDED